MSKVISFNIKYWMGSWDHFSVVYSKFLNFIWYDIVWDWRSDTVGEIHLDIVKVKLQIFIFL